MTFVCLWSPSWSTDAGFDPELAPSLTELAPRVVVESERVWADGRGLDARRVACALLARLAELGVPDARAGIAGVPVAARCAAQLDPAAAVEGAAVEGAAGPDGRVIPFLVKERTGWGFRQGAEADDVGAAAPRRAAAGAAYADRVARVEPGAERAFLGSLPVTVLMPEPRVRALLEGVGIETLGPLAALEREAVEVRFGPEGLRLWRLARAEDRRRLFRRPPPERPHASIDFVDYVLTDPARLIFTANSLLGGVCERLAGRGEHARDMTLVLPLANGEAWRRRIRPARPTASRDRWLRLIRALLERISVPDAVAGVALEVGGTEPAAVQQGDLFDRGFATAGAVEAAVARLVEHQGPVLVEPERTRHPLAERRTSWEAASVRAVERRRLDGRAPRVAEPGAPAAAPAAIAMTSSAAGAAGAAEQDDPPGELTLQLLPEPRRIGVTVERRRDHVVPTRIRDRGGWRGLVLAAGPDRISGGQWEADPYAREYFRCVTDDGVLLWIYRDARADAWYLHGWWD